MSERRIWGIHMDASVGTKPIDENYVGIGWSQLGNLSIIPPNRESFKREVQAKSPDSKPGSIPVQAGVLYRFVHEVNANDIVIYPSKVDRMVNIGKISGPYRHDESVSSTYPNLRPVTWIKHIPREEFSQDALYEIGSFITLFSVTKYASEFLTALGEKPFDLTEETTDDHRDDKAVSKAVATQAEETTQDFVIRQLKSELDPYQFEHFVAHLIKCVGYYTRVTAKSGDGGIDIIAHRDQLGFEPPIVKIQCKQTTHPIGRPDVTQLYGNVESAEHGLFVTLGSYTRDAQAYERSKSNLRLIDGEQLVELIFQNYEKFDPRYQSLMPLKRIYVPSLDDAQ